jgi:hypothetical protein
MDVFSVPPGELRDLAGSPDAVARFLTQAAACAPSVYGTAPWWFSATNGEVCVRADHERGLPIADPAGRELTISCGAAVFAARVALRYLGLVPEVSVLPEPDVPDLIARIGWASGRREPSAAERGQFERLPAAAATDGRFASPALPAGLMSGLGAAAAAEGTALRVMADADHEAALLAVTDAATFALRLDQARLAEASEPRGDGRGWRPPPADLVITPGSAGVVTILTTAADRRADWVAAGQALQRLLLSSASAGAHLAISSQALEFPALREFVAAQFAAGAAPQLLLRFGPFS